MIEAATLVDAGELQFVDRVGNLVQVLLGQMKVAGSGLQIFMPEQKLDGAQIGAGFEQMSGPAMTKIKWGGNPLADARPFSRFAAGTPYDLAQ